MLREARDMNRLQFAERLGVSGYSVVMNWDNSKYMPTVQWLAKICLLLNVSTDDVIYGVPRRYEWPD